MSRYEVKLITGLYCPVMNTKIHYFVTNNDSHLNHDKFPLFGSPIRPLLSKTQVDFKVRRAWYLAALVGYHSYTPYKQLLLITIRIPSQRLLHLKICKDHHLNQIYI